jgi:dynein heavy chain
VQFGRAVLFVGESGTAKTVIIQKYFSTLDVNNYLVLSMNFSSRTTSLDVQHSVEDSVEKKTKVYIFTNQKSVLDPILGLG